MITKQYSRFDHLINDAYVYVSKSGNKIKASYVDSKKYGFKRALRISNNEICYEVDISYLTIDSYQAIGTLLKTHNLSIEDFINKQLRPFC
jgi:hypothetical protein